jgi:hypothetical protein
MTLDMANANLGYPAGRIYRARHTGLHSPAAAVRHHSTTPASAVRLAKKFAHSRHVEVADSYT